MSDPDKHFDLNKAMPYIVVVLLVLFLVTLIACMVLSYNNDQLSFQLANLTENCIYFERYGGATNGLLSI